MERVGLRELRHDLTRYMRRVARGKRILITERGKPIAMLTPPPKTSGVLEQMIADGRATRAKGDLMDLDLKPVKLDDPYAGTKALEEQRAERDF